MPDDKYIHGLAEFVDKRLKGWARQKGQFLEKKFKRNYEAVTNRDFRIKSWKKEEAEGWRSKTWIGFVRVKIWSFYSVMIDTVLKAGKIPFSLQADTDDADDMDEGAIQDRDERIDKMTNKIQSQLAMRKADREYMQKWLSGAYYGMAFSKFNIEGVRNTVFRKVDLGLGNAAQYLSPEELSQMTRYELAVDEQDVPGHRYVSVWNMVWDMESDDLNGSGYGERIKSSPYDLRQLKGKPGYIDDAIERVIKDAKDNPGDKPDLESSPGKADLQERRKNIERYEFYMLAPRKMVNDFQKLMKSRFNTDALMLTMQDYEESEESGDDVEIMGEIADKQIFRFMRNESGRRPHHMWVVEKNLDESTGMGIADNMEDVQASLVGGIRALEDNKKLSANVTTAMKARFFNRPEQLDDIVPGKKYDISDACDDVRKAIMPIVFPDVGESLVSFLGMMMQFKDDVSMIPTIMQGFTMPKHQPDTAFELKQLTENAGKYIGQAIRNNDEMFIEPEIKDIYEYNMIFGEDESCKVPCKVVPNGFTSFQNKEIRGERMRQALGMFVSNEILAQYADIKPHLEIIYESMDEDPDKFIKSEDALMKEAQDKQQAMEAEAQAQQAAIQAQAEAEAAKAEQAHKFAMEENEQKHVQAMELAQFNSKIQESREEQQPKEESQGGSNA